jgi:hypothetical protein
MLYASGVESDATAIHGNLVYCWHEISDCIKFQNLRIFFLKRGKSFADPLIKKKRVAQLINGKPG